MNEQEYLEISAPIMRDKRPLSVNIQIRDAWILVGGLQLATRHPELTEPMKSMLGVIARHFQGAITRLYPEAQPLLEMGWDSEYDVESED